MLAGVLLLLALGVPHAAEGAVPSPPAAVVEGEGSAEAASPPGDDVVEAPGQSAGDEDTATSADHEDTHPPEATSSEPAASSSEADGDEDDSPSGAAEGDERLGGLTVSSMQVAVGWLMTSAVGTVLPLLNVLPGLGQLISILAYPCGGIGALSGLVVTLLGDNIGSNRGVLFWPMACGGGTQATCTSIGLAVAPMILVATVGGTLLGVREIAPELADGVVATAAVFGIYGGYVLSFAAVSAGLLGGLAGGPVAATLAYWVTSEEKGPGDDNSFMWPGWFEPNHPSVLTVELANPTPPPTTVASAMPY